VKNERVIPFYYEMHETDQWGADFKTDGGNIS